MRKLIMVLGDAEYNTLEKTKSVNNQVWDDEYEFVKYCYANRLSWMPFDDYIDLVNGVPLEESAIEYDLSKSYVQYCYINIL
jgi:hypothetical protein